MVSNYNTCKECEKNCCAESGLVVPLTEKEAKIMESLGLPVLNSSTYAQLTGDMHGCLAYDLGACDSEVYAQRPVFCKLYPVKLVAGLSRHVYGSRVTSLDFVVKDCVLGRELTEKDALREIRGLDSEQLDLLAKHAISKENYHIGLEPLPGRKIVDLLQL